MTHPIAPLDRRFTVAPMMDWTDRHCRVFHRLLTRRAVLYTEMVTADAVRFGDRSRLLGYSAQEHPLALQLGGSEPEAMAEAARIAEDWGYAEVNINVGCPSDRVQSGRFGACLMREPETVGRVVAAMRAAVSIPVTVKCRIGVDDQDPETALDALVDRVVDAGCTTIIVHARKAWLQGLSPKENRDVPPLDYDRVRRLKAARPELEIHLNGGLGDLDVALAESAGLDGMMVGRAAYQTPWMLSEVDARVYGEAPQPLDRHAVVDAMAEYADRMRAEAGTPLKSIGRHMLGLFQGLPGARGWRRRLSETMYGDDATGAVLREAASIVPAGESRHAA
ncbi:tRNA dihydrouridine(20/20a) synthase DusA [Thalassobaculum sp. OXR-137]|uniref:tRNA dihydrouridine(20/20a) synthase DusA n=1 Tax=Thalassobaculum sp. OXR-137 TaxID=3100173 RepID=UPI002AC8E12C|nr:tRNA dihydrouridine(20/20a) synthase DusA [Thalassobaculum sp. OXR-137]WPZ34823.1 tRNA dihydrouridine(20/20a) synthase DusA [Thalassobaculum sp. OXR-137]